MTTTTARHKLPLLVPGQAQKEMFHNESLAAIDALLHAAVEGVGGDVPPAAPMAGQSWIVGPLPSGVWAGHAHALASWTESGWRFAGAVVGMRVLVRATSMEAVWDGAAWRQGELRGSKLVVGESQVVGARRPGIADPVGGTTIDAEARGAVAAVLAAMRAHGLIA